MMKPLFAKDKLLERNLAQSEPVGTRLLHVASPSDFSLGSLVFVGDLDGANVEYLGAVTAVGLDSLSVAHALGLPRLGTATLWCSASALRWASVTDEPVERAFREGIAVERSAGGALWSVRVADAVREDTLRFKGISRAQFTDFRDWLAASARSGLDDFTWVDESRRVARVRLQDCDFKLIEEVPGSLTLAQHLALDQEGGYA
jgi:hypothetical protein